MKHLSTYITLFLCAFSIFFLAMGSSISIEPSDLNTNEITIPQVEVNYEFTFDAITPDNYDSLKIIVDPSNFNLPEEIFSAYLSVTLAEEDRNEFLELTFDGDTIRNFTEVRDITFPVSFVELSSYKLGLYNEGSAGVMADLDFTIRVDIVEGEFSGTCPMLPRGYTVLDYHLSGGDGEVSSKITYRFDSEEVLENETKVGDVMHEVYSYQLDRVLSKSWFDFICTEQGVIYTGMEIGQLPANFGNMTVMDIDVEWNDNYMPNYPVPGSNLPDARIKTVADAQIETSAEMEIAFKTIMDTKVTNRKVIGIEDITVEAGEFRAYKIEYDTDTDIDFEADGVVRFALRAIKRGLERAAQGHVKVWYVRDLGMVKIETTTSEGVSIMELINLER